MRRVLQWTGFTGGLGLAGLVLVAALFVARFLSLSEEYDPDTPLPVYDKVVVYTAHATMVAGGFVWGYREVAQEAFYLHVPGPGERTWRSDFPSASPRVQKHVQTLRDRIMGGQRSAQVRVTWAGYAPESQRFGLALNALDLTARRDGDSIVYTGVVECSYPEQAALSVTLVEGVTLTLEEGLYRALERSGWLHPYDARWTWREPL